MPQSGIYAITHDPEHADMLHEVAVIKGRRFPTAAIAGAPGSNLPTPRSMSLKIQHFGEEQAPVR